MESVTQTTEHTQAGDVDRAEATTDPDTHISARKLNILTLVVAVVLIAGGITVEQINRRGSSEELARPDLREDHIVNLRPETADVLPEAFIEKIALCTEAPLQSENALLEGAHGYSCKPWLTKEQDAEGLMTFHSPRDIVIGEEAEEMYRALPDYHDDAFQTSTRTVREATGSAPEVLVNEWGKDGFGGGDIFVYYPEEKVMVSWPWNKTDPGAEDVEAVVRAEGF